VAQPQSPQTFTAILVFALALTSCTQAEKRAGEHAGEGRSRSYPPGEIIVTEVGNVKVHTLVAPEIGNGVTSHAIETPSTVVVVDVQGLRPYARQFRALIQRLGKPISHVFISHAHPDHYFGLEFFQDAKTYALAGTMERIKMRRQAHWSALKDGHGAEITDEVFLPQIEAPTSKMHDGGVTFTMDEFENAEDGTQLVVGLPDHDILIVQDLATHGFHPLMGAGDLKPWISVLEGMLRIEHLDNILVGHGQPGGKEVLGQTLDYLKKAKKLSAQAQTQDAFVGAMAQEFPTLLGKRNLVRSGQALFGDPAKTQP
jgi:glyoxylase-like metal-dependent hydrolase (beta-lactamase superfamily II)